MSFHLSLSSDHVTAAHPDEPLAVSPSATIGEVLELMRTQKGKCVVICDDGPVSGIFTERDALRCMAAGTPLAESITTVMSPDPVVVQSDATVGEAIERMSQGGYRHLPIVDKEGKLSGLLAVSGIVHYLVEHFPDAIYNLPPEPDKSPANREGA